MNQAQSVTQGVQAGFTQAVGLVTSNIAFDILLLVLILLIANWPIRKAKK